VFPECLRNNNTGALGMGHWGWGMGKKGVRGVGSFFKNQIGILYIYYLQNFHSKLVWKAVAIAIIMFFSVFRGLDL
jgi:hypothetical protein